MGCLDRWLLEVEWPGESQKADWGAVSKQVDQGADSKEDGTEKHLRLFARHLSVPFCAPFQTLSSSLVRRASLCELVVRCPLSD